MTLHIVLSAGAPDMVLFLVLHVEQSVVHVYTRQLVPCALSLTTDQRANDEALMARSGREIVYHWT